MIDSSKTQTAAKEALYLTLNQQIDSVLDGVHDEVSAMATAACLIHQSLELASWTGFYRVVGPNLLRVGPYQGPLGCLEIAFDRGVCGAAAATGKTQLVEDVHAFPGHIACDAAARSEVVVPVFNQADELVAVLDVDSHSKAAFDASDQRGLEAVVRRLKKFLPPRTSK